MSSNDSWLEKIILVLNDWLHHPNLDNQFLANEIDISERQLYRKIKQETGKTPNQFIRAYRLKSALEFIHSRQYLTVQEIAAAVGYQNTYYFCQIFEKQYGESPMEVLKRLGIR